jgi:hypothetical protein
MGLDMTQITKLPPKIQDKTTQKENKSNTTHNGQSKHKRNEEFDSLLMPKLPFHVLGFNNQRNILIWHKGKILSIPISQLKPDDLKLLVGNLPGTEQNQQKPYILLKNQIIELAHSKGLIDDEEPIKSGIWKFKDEWIIVSGRNAASIKAGKFSFLEEPIINNRTIEFERTSWIDLNKLENHLKSPNLFNAFEKLRLLVSQWCWADKDRIDFVAAFTILSLFQHAISWRPWIYLLGAAHTGKSTFLEYVLERLMGCLIKRLDKSTGHATAQAIGWSGRVPIFDEFEKNKHMSDVLETMKLSNRGGTKTSGTTGEKHKEFSLHHMPWFASIYLPRTFSSDQAQLSRVIKFELKRVPEGKSIIGLSDDEAQELLCEIVASVISSWPEIETRAHKIEKEKELLVKEYENKISSRTIDNFMYAMSFLSCATGCLQKIPNWAISEIKDDGENILESVLMAKIRQGHEEFLVIDLINKILKEPINIDVTEATARQLLRNNGLSVVQKSTGWFLAIRCKDLGESLFKFHGDYQKVDISAPLERLEGAEKRVKTEWGNGVKQWALHIPGRHINAITEAE